MKVDAPVEPPASRSGRWRRHQLSNTLSVLLWLVVVPLAIVAVLRLFAWDDIEQFALLNTLTPFIYLPAWIVLVVAAFGRRPLLAVASFLIVTAQVAFLIPELSAAQPVPAWTIGAPTLRLLGANVSNGNPSMAGYARKISALRPQLVAMEEANPTDVGQLSRAGVLAHLPYRIEVLRRDPFGFFVAARYPLSGSNVVYLYGRPLMVQTTLELPSGPQSLWVVHTIAPVPASFSQWKGQLDTIGRLLRSRGPARRLVVGDFNATWGNRGFRGILAAGVTDGAAARGKAFDMTWSQTKPLLPPIVRIDHVLTGSGVTVVQIRTDDGPGSDHRALIATVAIDQRLPQA